MTEKLKYGQFYWCVKTPITKSGEIYLFADTVEIIDGALNFMRKKENGYELNLSLAPGQWIACYAASCIDGSAVAVEHWE